MAVPAAGDAADVALAHDPLDFLSVDRMALTPQRGVHARGTVGTPRGGVDLTDLLGQLVLDALSFGRCRPGHQPRVVAGAVDPHDAAQQGHAVAAGVGLGGLLRVDETAQRAYFIVSFAKKAAAESTG
ncbi:hypothetical protein OG972_44635 [Streptomyces sp. NBC_01669]|nr:hypothetical protein [Streptomyces sp. NBC_01669]MCX4538301.1 hypothetical protein [Streptomyces sp. NBC_01669]